jgi:hypothetical protein
MRVAHRQARYGIGSLAERINAILRCSGGLLFALTGLSLLLSLSWEAPEMMLVAVAYGGSAVVFVAAATTIR